MRAVMSCAFVRLESWTEEAGESRKTPRRRHWARAVMGAGLMVASISAVVAGPAAASPPAIAVHNQYSQSSGDAAAGDEPAYIVVAVDESGSITPGEMQDERTAATSILFDEFNPQSQVEVIGFGGQDAKASATNPEGPTICHLAPVTTPVQRQTVQNCVNGLDVRNLGQGNNTDFNAVVNTAVNDLQQAPAGYQRLLFMLTDGYLDVWGAPGSTGNSQQDVDSSAVRTFEGSTVPAAAQAKTSIFGLGFGPNANLDTLRFAAANSYSDPCSPGNAAEQIPSSATLDTALLRDMYSAARCAVYTPSGGNGRVGPGESRKFPVQVPAIATSGAIEVTTGSAQDQVTFLAPNGQSAPPDGTVDNTPVQLVGSGTDQSLHITDPAPGTWQVVVTAPTNAASQQITAGVLWTGRLQTNLVLLSTYLPKAGQAEKVQVQVSAHTGVTLTQQLLDAAGIQVVAGLSGAGFGPIRSVPLRPVPGQAGFYSGIVNVPSSATGSLAFTGVVTGNGVSADERTVYASIGTLQQQLTATMQLQQNTVEPGGTLGVSVQLDNESGVEHKLKVKLDQTPAGVEIPQPLIPLTAASGVRKPVTVGISVQPGTAAGVIGGTISLVDPVSGVTYQSIFLTARIVPPPTWFDRFRWPLLAAVLALLLVGLVGTRIFSAQRGRTSVIDITVALYDEQGQLIDHLPAESRTASVFPFQVVLGESDPGGLRGGRGGRLTRDDVGGGWTARRRRGGVEVRGPGLEPVLLVPDEPFPLGDGLQIGYQDHRPAPPPTLLDRWFGGGAPPPDPEPPIPSAGDVV